MKKIVRLASLLVMSGFGYGCEIGKHQREDDVAPATTKRFLRDLSFTDKTALDIIKALKNARLIAKQKMLESGQTKEHLNALKKQMSTIDQQIWDLSLNKPSGVSKK